MEGTSKMKREPLHPERWVQAPRAIALVQLKVKKGADPNSEPVGTFGLRWKEESAKPKHGHELKNKKLSDALGMMNVNAEEFTQSELEGFFESSTGTRRPSAIPALPLTDRIVPNSYVRAMSSTTGLPRYYTPMGYKQGALPAGTIVYVLQSMSLGDPGTVRAQVADSPMAGAPPLGWVTAMKQGKVNLDFLVSETAHAVENHLIGMSKTVEGGGASNATFYSSWPPQPGGNERTLGAGEASPRSSRAGSPARTPGATPRDIESADMWESLGSARQEVVDIAELLGSARGGPNSARGLSMSSPATSPKRPRRGVSERGTPGSPGSMASRIAAQRRERSEARSPNAKKKKTRLAAPSFMWRKLMQHAVRRGAALQRIDHEYKDISEKFGMLLLHGEKDVFNVRGGDGKGEIDVKKLVEAWDEDKDGDISRTEFRIAAYKLGFGTGDVKRLDGLYDCLDLDGDEQLQMHEVSGALEKWKQVARGRDADSSDVPS